MFIPVSSPIASIYDALVGEAAQKLQGVQCKSWTLSGATTALLDHKALFSDYAKSLGLLVPQHHLVTSPQQLMQLNSEKVGVCRHMQMHSAVLVWCDGYRTAEHVSWKFSGFLVFQSSHGCERIVCGRKGMWLSKILLALCKPA